MLNRLKPDYIEALVAYANALVDQGVDDDAIDMMERAISLVDNDADMFNNYGAFYTRLGNHGNIDSNQSDITALCRIPAEGNHCISTSYFNQS